MTPKEIHQQTRSILHYLAVEGDPRKLGRGYAAEGTAECKFMEAMAAAGYLSPLEPMENYAGFAVTALGLSVAGVTIH